MQQVVPVSEAFKLTISLSILLQTVVKSYLMLLDCLKYSSLKILINFNVHLIDFSRNTLRYLLLHAHPK